MTLRVRPLTLKQANEAVALLHRHHKPVVGHRFSVGAYDDDVLVGAAIVGRPVARGCDPYRTAEVTRLVTDGTRNACSLLYSACARACEAMGFDRIQTYILSTETGASLRASAWVMVAETSGGVWVRADGAPRRDDQPSDRKQRWQRSFRGTGPDGAPSS